MLVLLAFIAVALAFDFMNGFNDSANTVSTMIASRALSPRQALWISAACNFTGPFLFGVAVATTIGANVLRLPPTSAEAMPLLLAALLAAFGWNVFTWWRGVPSSSSHALIGGLIGSAVVDSALRHISVGVHGFHDFVDIFRVVRLPGLSKIVLALLLAPLFGFVAGFILTKITRFFARLASPRANRFFRRAQILTGMALSLSHGSNDAQKTMGIIAMALLASRVIPQFRVPIWVVALSAFSIAAGTAVGAGRLIKTLGGKFYKIRPIHGFTAQIGSASVIFGAALIGGPVSTSHVVSAAIMGAGSAERFSKVRWGVGRRIVFTWLVTIPASATVAGLFFVLTRKLF